MTKGKCAAFDTSCVHAPYYTVTSRRITEWAFFRSAVAFSVFFCLFCASLRVGLSVAKTGWMPPRVLGCMLLISFFVPLSSLRCNLVCLFHLFFAARSHFFALFRSGEVFGELSDQRDKTGTNTEKCPENNITLLFCEQTKAKISRTDFDIKK